MAGAYSGPHERRLLHDLMDQYNKVTNNTNIIVNMIDIDKTNIIVNMNDIANTNNTIHIDKIT